MLRVRFCCCTQDKEDLEEARAISAFNRRRMTGEIKLPEDQMKEEIHALQVNCVYLCNC